MDKIPPEILSQIVNAVADDGTPLAPYAPISRHFRAAVEQRTFERLILTTHDLSQFRELFRGANVHRRRFLLRILFRFVLPDDGPDPCCEAGRVLDRRADSQSFTESVKTLFGIISDLRKHCPTPPPPLYLRFVNAIRDSDPPYRNYGWCRRKRREHTEDDEIRSRVQRGFYEFLPEKLPALEDVTEFDFGGGEDLEDLARGWIGLILETLPALEALMLDVLDNIEWGIGVRRQLSEDLTKSLLRLSLSCLKHLTLTIRHTRLEDESTIPPEILHDATTTISDKLSNPRLILTHLSTLPRLTTLHLRGPLIITPVFFSSLPSTAFPTLIHFHLDFAPETADGHWFFERDDEWIEELRDKDDESSSEKSYHENQSSTSGDDYDDDEDEEDMDEDDDEEPKPLPRPGKHPNYEGPVSQSRSRINHFRTLPSSATLSPLLIAAAEIVKNASRLRKFIMRVRDTLTPEAEDNTLYTYPALKRTFEIMLLRPSEVHSGFNLNLAFDEERYITQHRMWWRVGNRWRPGKDVLEAWREAIGDGGIVGFLDEERFEKDTEFARRMEFYRGDVEIV
ncbi:hypothetical protein CC80DRAFT_541080 [Byssothecium circinans]|uniref:F-box domain-containing protein n=1 Tax=Byssothecium circinans TaxID=147558 RepID=A0A6A5TH92_9PLEO|nr:hypothetical protein CC80DRAFT_541080 [Byssothecium circinans]